MAFAGSNLTNGVTSRCFASLRARSGLVREGRSESVGQLTRRRYLGSRDLGDETGDEALDLVRRQVVAGDGVRLAEVAANDEGA